MPYWFNNKISGLLPSLCLQQVFFCFSRRLFHWDYCIFALHFSGIDTPKGVCVPIDIHGENGGPAVSHTYSQINNIPNCAFTHWDNTDSLSNVTVEKQMKIHIVFEALKSASLILLRKHINTQSLSNNNGSLMVNQLNQQHLFAYRFL